MDVAALDDNALSDLRALTIGFIFQTFNLIPVLDAAENAALPLTLDGVAAADAKADGPAFAAYIKKVSAPAAPAAA